MNNLFKFIGIIACVYGAYNIVANFNEDFQLNLLYLFGCIGLLATIFLLIRMIFGKQWKTTLFKKTVVGEDLIQAIEDSIKEAPTISDNTKARLVGNLIFRFTRIGIIALLIAFIPIILLFQQNQKIDHQNDLITNQNTRLGQQTNLQEAGRRSSLVFLFSNVLDAIDKELREDDNNIRDLSPQLVGRIISISKALKPYRYLENDTLIPKPLSPERGHLLVSILSSELGKETLSKIFRSADFSYSDLRHSSFFNTDMANIRLSHSNFEGSFFHFKSIRDCMFDHANMKKVIFIGDLITGCYFGNTILTEGQFKCNRMSLCHFDSTQLNEASLEDIKFKMTSFENANLMNAKFKNSSFITTNFEFANLNGLTSSRPFDALMLSKPYKTPIEPNPYDLSIVSAKSYYKKSVRWIEENYNSSFKISESDTTFFLVKKE